MDSCGPECRLLEISRLPNYRTCTSAFGRPASIVNGPESCGCALPIVVTLFTSTKRVTFRENPDVANLLHAACLKLGLVEADKT